MCKLIKVNNMAKGKWTSEDIEYLKNNYGKIPTKEIAKNIDRPTYSIYYQVKRMGLYIKEERNEYSRDDYIKRYIKKERHLCWGCKHAVNKPIIMYVINGKSKLMGKCPWADHLEPVKGWKIEASRERSVIVDGKVKKRKFFNVIKCPLYEVG